LTRTTRNWASSGRVKIERAYEHVRDLESRIETFRKVRPYLVVPDIDPDRKLYSNALARFHSAIVTPYVVRAAATIPPIWSGIVADAIHSLNVALDYLWQRTLYGTSNRRKDHFPAVENPKSAKARFRGKEQGACKAAVDLLNAADAFRVGNPFWDIRCFDDADKHDTMVLVAGVPTGMRVTARPGTNVVGPSARWHVEQSESAIRLRDGNILPVLENGTKWWGVTTDPPNQDEEYEAMFEIAFGESEVLKGQPVLPTIKNMTQAVDSLASTFLASGLLK
jgi:hypothetical protein